MDIFFGLAFFRTLQSPIGPKGSDVTVVQRLHLRCADHFFLESSMSSDHFGQLHQLEELRIQYCKLRHLPAAAFSGLTNLKTLEIHSHNDDWSSVLMDVTKDTFQKLVNLRHLNLAFNNLWSLPSGKNFCHSSYFFVYNFWENIHLTYLVYVLRFWLNNVKNGEKFSLVSLMTITKQLSLSKCQCRI